MNVKVRVVLLLLAVVSFSILPAHACVTSADLSGGGWETSAATDPCAGGVRPTILQGQVNASPTYASSIQRGRSHLLVSLEISKHHQMSLLVVPFLALCLGLSRKGSEFSRPGEIQAMLEAQL
jgi:hypothetical protein